MIENIEVYYDSDGWHGCPCDGCKKKQETEDKAEIKIIEEKTSNVSENSN